MALTENRVQYPHPFIDLINKKFSPSIWSMKIVAPWNQLSKTEFNIFICFSTVIIIIAILTYALQPQHMPLGTRGRKNSILVFVLFALHLKQFGLPHGVNKAVMLFFSKKNTIIIIDYAFITEQINFFLPLDGMKRGIISN